MRKGHLEDPRRRLGLVTASMLVVASMVGTGVFTTTGFLVRDVGSSAAVLLAWGLGGALALAGALAYAELVAALPHNGGEYQLLSRIYHPSVGFVSGFTALVVGFSAPMAASALAFGEYLSRVVPAAPPLTSAVVLVVASSALHAFRVGLGGGIQNVATIGKVVLIAAFIAGGLCSIDPALLGAGEQRPTGEALLSPAFAVGLIYVSFAYTGWNAAAYVAGEVRRPARTLPLALLGGTLLVTLLYLGLNWIFLTAAPPEALAGQVEVGHIAATHLLGEAAGRTMSALIAIGLVSTVGALVMTGPRIYEAMGEDYPRLRWLVRGSPRTGPVAAIALQGSLALVMVWTASFDELLTYIGFTLSLFAALTVAGVFVLRIREPDLDRPYRTWGHPVTTAVAVALMGWMMLHAILERPLVSWVGLGTLAAGSVLYGLLRTSKR